MGERESDVVRRANEDLERFGWQAMRKRDARRAAEALKFEFYWNKARKRIDIRALDGFGPLAARAIEAHRTGMKHDRLYTLWQAVSRLRSATQPIVEIGSYQGGSAHFIASALRWHGRNNPFYVCDTFQGHAVVDPALDGSHEVGQQFVNTSYEDVAAYLSEFDNIHLVQGDFRQTSRALESVGPFAFAHLDVDVYPVTCHALEFLAPRMLPGGALVVDDYGFTTCQGVRQAVAEFAEASPGYFAVHLLTGQALLVRLGVD